MATLTFDIRFLQGRQPSGAASSLSRLYIDTLTMAQAMYPAYNYM